MTSKNNVFEMTRNFLFVAMCIIALGSTARAETRKVVIGAGCFWCVEAIYEQLPGVVNVVSGYAGGPEENPNYDDVGHGRTGHAEVVEIEYDPEKTTLRYLVDFFWKTHDVTDPTGVWPDFGKQYRSILFYNGDEERGIIQSSAARQQQKLGKPIATQIVPLQKFWPAEDYHQNYVKNNPDDRYVRQIAYAKLKKLDLKAP
jgi:peptide-methionine (S)-S-oxide reductase